MHPLQSCSTPLQNKKLFAIKPVNLYTVPCRKTHVHFSMLLPRKCQAVVDAEGMVTKY